MRLLFVVQRYGREVAGGAELHCRELATRLAHRGHEVEVLTSCAISYVDWANAYSSGTESFDEVTVHRLPVAAPRDERRFTPLNHRVVGGHKPVPLYLQREWMRLQGPYLPDLASWLGRHAGCFEVVIFFTYLYYPTWAGLPAARGLAPTVLHPTAHDEPPFYLPLFDPIFSLPSAFAFSTPEEARLVQRRFHREVVNEIVGIGVELDMGVEADEQAFRASSQLGDRPYLLFVGRVDPGKGSDEIYDFFLTYKRRNPGPLALVILGDPVKPPPPHTDVILTGFVDEATKRNAMAGALALVQPSYFESFSMVLTEAWVHRKPVLAQGRCEVLEGQVRRSGGGIPYRGYAEFEAALDMLVESGDLRVALGEAGRRYVEERYAWDAVLGCYEQLLTETKGSWRGNGG